MKSLKPLIDRQTITVCNHQFGTPINCDDRKQDVHLDKKMLANNDEYIITIPFDTKSPCKIRGKGNNCVAPTSLKKEIKKIFRNPETREYFREQIIKTLAKCNTKRNIDSLSDELIRNIAALFNLKIRYRVSHNQKISHHLLCDRDDILYYIRLFDGGFEVGMNYICAFLPSQITHIARILWAQAIYITHYKELKSEDEIEKKRQILEKIAKDINGIGEKSIEITLNCFSKDLFFQKN